MTRIDPDRLTAWYDVQAPLYGLWRDAPTGPLVRSVADRLALDLGAGPRSVLDVGCGTGMFGIGLALRSPTWRVTGIDASTGMLRVATRSALRRGVADRVRFQIGDAAALPAADGTVDVVVLAGLLPNLSAWGPTLTEARRVLGPDGTLVVVEVDREAMGVAFRLFFRAMILAQRGVATLAPRFRFADRWDLESTTVSEAAVVDALRTASFAVPTVRRAHAHLIVTTGPAPGPVG